VAAFYSWLVGCFYSFTGRQSRFLMFGLLLCVRSEIEKIVHWMPEVLFAAEIAFRGLDRCVPEQKLNLLQFTPPDHGTAWHKFSGGHAARCVVDLPFRSSP
jgi:hypothetical protein